MDTETAAIIWSAAGALIRHGLTTVAGILVTVGWVMPAQQANFVDIGTGIVLGVTSLAWSLWQKRNQQKEVRVLKQEIQVEGNRTYGR
jgi:membrane protein DedA with SNARE-associated domain